MRDMFSDVTKETEGRKKSKLVQAGDEAKRLAMRALLLETLVLCRWNLTATAEALEMGQSSAVLRAIREVGLEQHYEKARNNSDVRE
jgi:hypothetical protein